MSHEAVADEAAREGEEEVTVKLARQKIREVQQDIEKRAIASDVARDIGGNACCVYLYDARMILRVIRTLERVNAGLLEYEK